MTITCRRLSRKVKKKAPCVTAPARVTQGAKQKHIDQHCVNGAGACHARWKQKTPCVTRAGPCHARRVSAGAVTVKRAQSAQGRGGGARKRGSNAQARLRQLGSRAPVAPKGARTQCPAATPCRVSHWRRVCTFKASASAPRHVGGDVARVGAVCEFVPGIVGLTSRPAVCGVLGRTEKKEATSRSQAGAGGISTRTDPLLHMGGTRRGSALCRTLRWV